MIKKLQRKFIIINMSLVTIVLLVVLLAFGINNSKRYYDGINSAMDMALSNQLDSLKPQLAPSASDQSDNSIKEEDIPPEGPEAFSPGKTNGRKNMMTPVVTVTLNDDSTIDTIDDSGASIEESTAQEAVDSILNSGNSKGKLRDLSLYYQVSEQDGITRIALADYSQAAENTRNVILTCIFIFIGASFAFFLISLFLSRWALRPVEKAWTQQQQFVADASHELKTPLTVILANLDILSAHRTDTIANHSRWLDNTKAEADRMKTLLDDLLFLAKSDASTVPEVRNDFDLSQTVWSSILLFESVAYEQKVTLTEEITDNIHFVGNEKQFKQVIAILLDNACKYAKGGNVLLTLNRISDKIQLSVHNSGTFISTEDQEHIFERFYRSDKSRVRKEGGYGLGLSIAQTIVHNHSGKIKVTSREGEGTTFTIVLPGMHS